MEPRHRTGIAGRPSHSRILRGVYDVPTRSTDTCYKMTVNAYSPWVVQKSLPSTQKGARRALPPKQDTLYLRVLMV
jgi:hypothetical protein